MTLYLYIPSLLAHPDSSCLKGLIVGNFLRFQKQNTPANIQTLRKNFAVHLHARGHTFDTIKFQFTRAANILDKKRLLKLPTQANTALFVATGLPMMTMTTPSILYSKATQLKPSTSTGNTNQKA